MTRQSVPHNDRRSRESEKRPVPKCVVKQPKIRVLIAGEAGYGGRWADAHLVIRRGCYRYMRWRVGRKVQEFYLGKLENHTTQKDRAARRYRPAPAARVCGTKKFPILRCPDHPALMFITQDGFDSHIREEHTQKP